MRKEDILLRYDGNTGKIPIMEVNQEHVGRGLTMDDTRYSAFMDVNPSPSYPKGSSFHKSKPMLQEKMRAVQQP